MVNQWADRIKTSTNIFHEKISCNAGITTFLFSIIPILSANHVQGGLAVMKNPDNKIAEEDYELLNSLADQAALAMENARLRKAAEEMAVVSERNRIARDLHDAITQTLFSANLIAESLPQTFQMDSTKGGESLKNLQELNRSALAEMRALLLELRPAVIKDIPLSDLLEQMADTLRGRAGVRVTLGLDERLDLSEDVHMQFYRIAQEITTNIIKHAKAKNVSIRLRSKTYNRAGKIFASVRMSMADDGVGFDQGKVEGIHFGLKDIAERAESIGAKLFIESGSGKGTKIDVDWKTRMNRDGGCE
jgi:signal transduction histidine kinase